MIKHLLTTEINCDDLSSTKCRTVGNIAERNHQTFTRLANEYDKLNQVMSMGMHKLWRRRAVAKLELQAGDCILDVAAGTGDMTLAALRAVNRGNILLLDVNSSMLNVAQQKLRRLSTGCQLGYLCADGHSIPLPDGTIDKIMVGFGLRLDNDIKATLQELYRVLKKGGRVAFLELAVPKTYWNKPLFEYYVHSITPLLSKWMVNKSYDSFYLSDSLKAHPDPLTISYLIQQAGFSACHFDTLAGGSLTIHSGDK